MDIPEETAETCRNVGKCFLLPFTDMGKTCGDCPIFRILWLLAEAEEVDFDTENMGAKFNRGLPNGELEEWESYEIWIRCGESK